MTDRAASITDFITDGSLIRLCEVASRLIGAPVELRDERGRNVIGLENGRIVFAPSAEIGGADAAGLAAPSVGAAGDAVAAIESAAEFTAPLVVDSEVIGRIAIAARPDSEDDGRRTTTNRFVELLARTVSEVCQRESEQRQRAEELQALYKLSSLLVGAGSVSSMLEAGVREAVAVLGADAGVARLVDEDTGALQVRARAQADPSSAPCDCAFDACHDRAAMQGEVVWCDDLRGLREGRGEAGGDIASILSTGLMFRGKPLGVLCLYWRERKPLSPAERGLFQSIGQQLAAAVANSRLVAVEAEGRRVNAQVKLAADVQRRMLPRSVPQVGSLDIDARFVPCFELGGDFYDLFDLGGHVGLVVGDVVGKGVAAALLMSHVRASLRAHARDLYDLDEVMARTNQALCRDTLPNEFATIFYGVIDPKTLRLTYCNAGHEPPIIVHKPQEGGPTLANISELTTGGMVVGVDPTQRYQRGSFDLRPGDVMLAYTDGLPDAMNFENQKFGKRRIRLALLDILTADPNAPAKRIAQHVHWEMRRFAGLATPVDDTTLVVVKVKGGG